MSNLSSFSVGEQKFITAALAKGDAFVFGQKANVVVDMKKNKIEERLVIVGKLKIYLITAKGKAEEEAHFIDLLEIHSASPTQIVIKMKNFAITIPEIKDAEPLIKNIFSVVTAILPGIRDTFPFAAISEDRISKIKQSVDAPEKICGGFVDTYKAVCEYMSIPQLDDICWDISNLYVWNEITEFSINELQMRKDPLRVQDWKALLKSMQHNTWFTSFTAESCELEKDVFNSIAEIFQYNCTIRELVLKNLGAPHSFFSTLGAAFENNTLIYLSQIDVSNNEMEDKGMISFAAALGTFKRGLTKLNVASNNVGPKGLAALAKALSGVHASTLESLSVANNKLDVDVTRAFSTLFASTPKLTHLNLSFTNVEYPQLKKCEGLTSLNIAGNKIITKDSKHLDLFNFLKHAPKIQKLILSMTPVPPEILKGLVDSLPAIEYLDLNDTGLGDAGVLSLCEALTGNKTLKVLNLNNNFDKKSKQRAKAVSALDLLVSGEKESVIEELYLAGGNKGQLRDDLIPFIFSLMANKRLKVLDISRNQSGNRLGLALGKAVSTNETLEKLYWDENNVTFLGFQYFRNGMLKNDTITHMPLPLHDIVSFLKANEKSPLPELLKDVEQKIFSNCLRFGKEKGGPSPSTSAPTSPKTVAHVPNTPRNRETRSESRVDITKFNKSHRNKPTGLDTQHVSVLFGQINDVLAQATETGELSPEEVEAMKIKKK